MLFMALANTIAFWSKCCKQTVSVFNIDQIAMFSKWNQYLMCSFLFKG